jgi:predicted site-specific integrase-resolvase
MDKLLTRKDMAELLQVTLRTIDNYQASGLIKPVPRLPITRFNESQIETMLGNTFEGCTKAEKKELEQIISNLEAKIRAYEEIRIAIIQATGKIINL